MAKIVPIGLSIAAAVAASGVGIKFLVQHIQGKEKEDDSNKDDESSKAQKQDVQIAFQNKFASLSSFKQTSTDNCVQSLFSNVNLTDLGESKELGSTTSFEENYFGEPSTPSGDQKSGCLIIERSKATYTNGLGRGVMNWVWTFQNGNKGFVNFNVAKTSNTQKALEVTGGFYLLEHENETGKVKYRKEVTENSSVKITTDNFQNRFPKSKSTEEGKHPYWGLVESADKLNSICNSEAGCYEESPTVDYKEGQGSFLIKSSEGSDDGGCENLDGGKAIYGGNHFQLDTQLSKFKGTGGANDSSDLE